MGVFKLNTLHHPSKWECSGSWTRLYLVLCESYTLWSLLFKAL